MNAKQALQLGIDMGEMICQQYLEDLSDAEMMKRPAPGCNHINWQLGHLIASEHMMISAVDPQAMPALPEGFAERYSRENTGVDDPAALCSKAELMQTFAQQRAATRAALERIPESELDRETGISYAPTAASMFSMQGSHWLMHAGQWAVVRRQLGRAPLM